MSVQEMLRTHPAPSAREEWLGRTIEELMMCVQACTVCADACLAEKDPTELRRCISLNLDCTDVCSTAARY